ncbi:MAG: caspase family protein, partial [Microscillaceae bacterium]|nr:caspase family protein [Microscillaceae bacterium]
MAATLYALLIGINKYPNVPHLQGCVADVLEMAQYLQSNFSGMNPQIKVLTDIEATRQQIINQFRKHLGQAQAGDTVYFHFSGHGSRENAPEEFWPFYPEKKNETLVCFDSRLEGGMDLADKELAVLLHELSQNECRILVCLDCCHSGSGTRNTLKLANKRQTEKEGNTRKIGDYLEGYYEKMLKDTESITIPLAPHLVFSACRSTEVAWETSEQRGLFSNELLRVLKSDTIGLSYAEIFERTRAAVRMSGAQEPQFSFYGDVNPYEVFLNKNQLHVPKLFSLFYEQGHWKCQSGALQGMPTETKEVMRFAIFPEGLHEPQGKDQLTELKVMQVKKDGTLFYTPQDSPLDVSKTYAGL